jgi:hypothetical protein
MLRRIVISAAVIFAVACFAVGCFARYALMRDYHGNLIRAVIESCESHVRSTGAWPKSWNELEAYDLRRVDWEYAKQVCKIDFSASCTDVSRMSVEDFDAISPLTYSYTPNSAIELLINECSKHGD